MIKRLVKNLEEGMKIGMPVYDEDGLLLLGRGVVLNRFLIQSLKRKGVTGVFVRDEDTEDIVPHENISDMVRGATIRHMKELFDSLRAVYSDMKAASRATVREMVATPKFKAVFGDNPIYHKIRDSVGSIVNEILNGEVSLGLSSIKSYDNYLFQHSIDTTIFAVLIGRKAGLSPNRLRDLGIGCLLHDIGTIFLPKSIIDKPDSLTPDEIETVRTHPSIGYELTKDVAGIGMLPPHVALQHHERQDGTGYPRGLPGANNLGISGESHVIHLYAGICSVADVYDALSSDRPYRPAHPPEKVVEMLREMAGTHLNRMLLDLFLSFAPPFPVASNVRVVSGDFTGFKGVVVSLNKDAISRPVIRLLYDEEGLRIDPITLDLSRRGDIRIESTHL